MTNEEFATFTNRLFVAFPSVLDWLKSASPDPQATLVVWRECLRPYALAQCLSVVERWSNGQLSPPPAYDRDKTHLHMRAVIEGDRAKAARRREAAETHELAQARRRQRGSFAEGIERSMDSEMRAAFDELRPIHARHVAGELDLVEYARTREQVIGKWLGA